MAGSVFSADIAALAEARITKGCNPPANTRFCPDAHVTRAEMAAFLVRALDLPADDHPFLDTTGHIFQADVASLAAAGITKGCNPPTNNRFCPDAPVTRGQMAAFLGRALGADLPEVTQAPVTLEEKPRSAWGARPAKTQKMKPHTIRTLTIHHDGSPGTSFGPGRIAGYQAWHMDHHGWGDIAYHYIIGRDGTVYEGRDPAFRGDTGTSYDTTGHLLVVLEGHLDHNKPTDAQIDSLTKVMAWAADTYGIDPSWMLGHRHHPGAHTTCPGKHLVALIENGYLAGAANQLRSGGGAVLTTP